MDNTDIKYTLILEGIDRLEHGMQSAKHHTDALEESMHHLKAGALELIGAYAGFEVLKESLEEFEKHQVAVADLTQMYKNNGEAVGMTLDKLKELAEAQENLTGIHSEVTMAAESTLMKYKDLKVSYEELIPLAGDMGTKLGGSESAANMLGRALENPAKAMRLLVQAGVSPDQQKMYENLAKTGHAAESQAYLVDILKEKYQGLAQAAYESDPSAQLAIGFKQLKESIGELIEEGLVALMPYIKMAFEGIKSFVGFLKDHTGTIKFLAEALIAVGIAMKAQAIYTALAGTTFFAYASEMGIATAAEYAMETATFALNKAMDANPVAIVVLAVAALTAGIMDLIDQYDELEAKFDKGLHDTEKRAIDDETNSVNKLADAYEKQGMKKKEAQERALMISKQDIQSEIDRLNIEYANAKGGEEKLGIAQSLVTAQSKKAALNNSKIFDKTANGKGISSALTSDTSSKSDKVTGQKQVTINVSMKDLVGVINIIKDKTTDGITNMGEHVAKALLSAVDQFSASAEI